MEEKQKKNPVFVEETELNCLVLIKRQKCLSLHKQMSFKFMIKNGNTYSSDMSVRLGIRWAVLRIFAMNLDNLSSFLDHSTSPCR